ncbi:Y-family DNA polymerase [Bacillus subtilis]|uniref:IMPB/MUCB/SAMB family protein n=1 Tax=Bacillus subtilis TaxID=1423 RepID=A0A0D1KYG5_BACIU|nr:IMPB/MUCB/SAMB family protein [Bacillus subtilis]MEC0314640.1 Y-family DNA polymerase [Bacillus subtilis]MEC0363512.1 Y-family DNA polymerase [Bacillus subtilis]WEY83515.1 Y-family DNA polymerase [Bacillus subtilis]
MINYSQFPRKNILCVDMKSFYAFVSAVSMGLNPLTCYLAVVGNTERQGSVVLAASPALKKDFGIKTGSRMFEIPEDPRIHIVNPQMKLFIRVSTEITKLFYRFVPEKCVHTFSIDESFLDAGKEDPEEMAKAIQSSMWREFGLVCTVGIGDNMLLSKLALDLESKKTKSGIARWRYEDVPNKLWKVRPLSKMWGIGGRMERNLNRMGISTVGQLAKFPLELLEKKFGIMGNQLYYHAHGIDLSEIGAPLLQGQISFGKSQILLRDYTRREEIKTVLLEICEEVARRARTHNKAGRTISLGIGYSKDDLGGGFSPSQNNRSSHKYHDGHISMLLDKFYSGKTVRSISVTLSNFEDDVNHQLSLFEVDNEKRRKLGFRSKYRSKAILRAVSYTSAGTALHRAGLTGGHKS